MRRHIFITTFFVISVFFASASEISNKAYHLDSLKVEPFKGSRDLVSLTDLFFANKQNLIIGASPNKEKIKQFYKTGCVYDQMPIPCTAVIHDEDKVIGFISYNNKGHIVFLAVDKTCRRKGYGTALVNYVLDEFKQKKLTFATISTTIPNALTLYKKIGFKETHKKNGSHWLEYDLRSSNKSNSTSIFTNFYWIRIPLLLLGVSFILYYFLLSEQYQLNFFKIA